MFTNYGHVWIRRRSTNNTLIELAFILKTISRYLEKKLEKYNSHWFKDLQGGPLGPQEVLNTQNSLAKKDYFLWL